MKTIPSAYGMGMPDMMERRDMMSPVQKKKADTWASKINPRKQGPGLKRKK